MPAITPILDRAKASIDLVATAICDTGARAKVRRLADEQAALRHVATLVAHGVPASELFGAVAEEVGRLLGTDLANMIRYETDDTVTALAAWGAAGEHVEVGGRWPLDGDLEMAIASTGRPARIDDYDRIPVRTADLIREQLGIGSSVGSPIVVERRVWGALIVHSTRAAPLPADTESRLENFTELVATAMSNAQARAEADRLADEQAALRRVATLVAREASPGEVFAAVADEVGRLLRVEATTLLRYEPDGSATLVAHRGEPDARFPVGSNVTFEREDVEGNVVALVLDTGRPVRFDDFARVPGAAAAHARTLGIRCAVATPIVVEGRLWGTLCAFSRRAEPLPADTEARIGEFTELVATAIANIQARSELAASRARIVAATDAERRRVVRDLHDGAQQRLVHTVITLKLARVALQKGEANGPALVNEALDNAQQATDELRELAHGILPAVLTRGGLRAGVEALASRTPLPVDTDVSVGRLPPALEATAYFVVAEALTNTAKHAHANRAWITATVDGDTLRLEIRDDGVGGACIATSTGLLGLRDRAAAMNGGLRVDSKPGAGTVVAATLPIPPA